MSRRLGVDRVTCQRIAGVLAGTPHGIEALVRLPGVAGLRQVVDAAQQAGVCTQEQADTAAAAVDAFEGYLRQVGGSQRRLAARLAEASGAVEPKSAAGTREALFHAAAELTGRWSECFFAIYFFRPSPEKPLERMERIVVSGHTGHTWRADAVPLILGGGRSVRDAQVSFSTLDKTPASGNSPRVLLEPFCSKPLPRVTSRTLGRQRDAQVMHIIDPAEAGAGGPMDIVLASRTTESVNHPLIEDPPLEETWMLVTFPARSLVFDVYLHRELAGRSIPSLEQHLWGPDLMHTVGERWGTRFPGAPRLTLLGPGAARTGAAESVYNPRHAELTRTVFGQVGWESGEYVGYRCEVEYPAWRIGYCMTFDFSAAKAGPGAAE